MSMDEKEFDTIRIPLSTKSSEQIDFGGICGIESSKIDPPEIEVGKYRHFKNNYYIVFCSAVDLQGNKYVLYQSDHENRLFWIRPYDMFFELVVKDGEEKERFTKVSKRNRDATQRIGQLISKIENQEITIRHTETEEEYEIIRMNTEDEGVLVHPISARGFAGYLTAYEIVKRMGYQFCQINGVNRYIRLKTPIQENRRLSIGKNDEDMISKHLNPCSIDLGIANGGFLRTKYRLVDPQSIEHFAKPTDLWKNVRLNTSKDHKTKYFKIRPNETILTHTKERIKIPNDCAGKIEIKSTFARLSLSLTFGDFCNPGYEGFFPLEIKNNGRHTIIIHEGEIMAQLILIPLSEPFLNEYSQSATYKNNSGYDDGTPYSFWRERSITALRNKNGTQELINLYIWLLEKIDSNTTSDVNGYKERFNNTFLPFCQKRAGRERYSKSGSIGIDIKKVFLAYTNREKIGKRLAGIKWFTGIMTVVCGLLPLLVEKGIEGEANATAQLWTRFGWFFYIGSGCWLVLSLLLVVLYPKTFCTFDKIDVDQFIEDQK